ncbi:hypothetical protein C2G38_2140003 [Gigaspora rosea]|uniref:HAT C-terminal dimerisation domain-containing protein n=1 Tax=Gigaspora rosea TaxID=44941 RepID=A0A397VKB0_9GLOM|nr:hypothetical protein C2G38_2140003 [Gigaspora rosea]
MTNNEYTERATNNEYTERATNNEYTKHATNNYNEISNDLASETGSSIQTESSNAYFDAKEAIDKAKKKRANQSLIKWIVSSGILFSAFDNPYFEDYTKALNPSYDPPKRTDLTTSILDSEAANIIIKVDKELSKAKNLTLCIDSWCSPLKHSSYAFVIITSEKKQGFREDWTEKFTAVVSDAESSITAAKRQVLEQEHQIFICANNVKNLINDRQFWIDIEQLRNILGNFLEVGIYKNYVFRKMIEIWKQIGGGDISADPFDDEFIPSDTITDWWLSIDLKKNEDHIKTLTLKVLSVLPHNATCEQLFSILNWYLGKRQTRISIEHLEVMAQMHSFLVKNAKLELNFVEQNLRQKDLLSIFNKIASSIEDGSDLFSEEDSFTGTFLEEHDEEKTDEELEDLV